MEYLECKKNLYQFGLKNKCKIRRKDFNLKITKIVIIFIILISFAIPTFADNLTIYDLQEIGMKVRNRQ